MQRSILRSREPLTTSWTPDHQRVSQPPGSRSAEGWYWPSLDSDRKGYRPKPQKADSPISPEILWAWGEATDDPDACTLATWIRRGAPLGFAERIPTNGIFPVVEGAKWTNEGARSLIRDLDGWENYPSAVEESQALSRVDSGSERLRILHHL